MRGVLVAIHKDCIVIDHSEFLGGEASQVIDGEVVVLRPNVSWIQVIEPEVNL